MAYRNKKFLSLLLSTALINSSIQPLYASFPEHENEVVKKAGAHARLDMLEEALQNKIKSSATVIENWTPSFIKSAVSKIGSWFEATFKDLPPSYFAKSPFEIDYVHDRAYWQAHFSAAVDEIQEKGLRGTALKERLTQLQDLVFNGTLSPYTYEKGLKELETSMPEQQTLVISIREEFKNSLKTAPGFIDDIFRREASLYIQDLQAGHSNSQEFISFIRHYRGIDNALDYKNTLASIRSYLREHKGALEITKKDYDDILAALNTEIGRTSKAEKKSLKARQAFSVAASSVLPYFGQEWDELTKPTNNSLAAPSKEKGLVEDYLDASTKALRKLVHTGAKYVQEHPTQAFMMALAGQVVAAAAYNSFRGPETVKVSNRQATAQARPLVAEYKEKSSPPYAYSFLQGAANIIVGDEFLINQITTNYQSSPSVAALTNGNAFVAWEGNNGSGSNLAIYGRLFSANGTALTPQFMISQNTTYPQSFPSVAALTNGNAFVVWEGDYQTGNYSDIYGRLFSSNGTALGSELVLNQITTGYQEIPSVAALTNGNAFVAWQSTPFDINGRLFSPNGTALSSEFGINNTTFNQIERPSVAALTNGNAFVAWQTFDRTGNFDIYGRVLSSNGTALSSQFGINQITAENQASPSVAALTNGNAFVAWSGSGFQTIRNVIYGRLFSANGTALVPEFMISQIMTCGQMSPSVAALTNGNAFVAWWGDNASGNNYAIYGRLFSADGTALTPQLMISQNINDILLSPSVAALTNGNAFVAWGRGSGDIYGCIIYTNTGLTTGTTGIGTTGTISSSTTGPFPTTAISSLTTGTTLMPTTGSLSTSGTTHPTTSLVLTTGSSTSNSLMPSYQSSTNYTEIIIPVVIAGGTFTIAAGGAGYYIYKRQRAASNTSLQGLELVSVPYSQVGLNSLQQVNREDIQASHPAQLIPYTSMPLNLISLSTKGSMSSQQLETEENKNGSEDREISNPTQPTPYVAISSVKEASTVEVNERTPLLPKEEDQK